MKIRFSIAPDFCREQFLAGYEVAPEYELECPLGALTPSERQFIVSTYPPDLEGVIYNLLLEVPAFDASKNIVHRTPWMCRANPDVLGARGVVKEWMKDYVHLEKEVEHLQAKAKRPARSKSSGTAKAH